MKMDMNFQRKKELSALAITLTLLCTAQSVAANDGSITFTGSIQDATCIITGGDETNSNQTENFTVTLPSISTTALKKANQVAGDTQFFINLSGTNCPTGKVANVIFERAQSTNIDTTTGNLKNHTIAGSAKNVQVRILNGTNKTPLNLSSINSNHQPVTITANKAQFKYWAQYIATGIATAGTVKTDVIYSIGYN